MTLQKDVTGTPLQILAIDNMTNVQGDKSSKVQSLLFDKDKFTEEQATAWSQKHGFKSSKTDVTENKIRLRQFDPSECDPNTYGTKEITDGVQAIFCVKKKNVAKSLSDYAELFGEDSPVGSLIGFFVKTEDPSILPILMRYSEDLQMLVSSLLGRQSSAKAESNPSYKYAIKGIVPEQQITYGEVYGPDQIDLQDEWASSDVIAKAAHNWLADYRYSDLEHSWDALDGSRVVESFVAPLDIHTYFGQSLGEDYIREGTWVAAIQWPDNVWSQIKEGSITGYSLGGRKAISPGLPPNFP